MNFARNVKCLECEEHRPKRQITRGEWECPQCDFYNYGRNMVCLRCDCKRPGDAPFGTVNSTPELGYNNGDCASKADVDSRLAANEEKARRWFTKLSQSNNESDLSSAVTDEDFPEIMPSRKGVNRFVVSPRKTPLERRLANSQHQRNLGNKDGIPEGNNSQTDGANKTLDESIGRSLDQILGQRDTVSATNEPEKSGENFQLSEKPASPAESQDKDEEEAKKSERWFKRVAELHDVKDLENAISDEDFPEIMPMRKGENRFVISKKKDRSLTSPMYKRQMAMEQASNTKFVPFVPFPPNYFAKKQRPDGTDSTVKSIDETSSVSVTPVRHPEKSDYNARIGETNMNHVQSSKSSVDFGEPVQSSKSIVDFGEPSNANPTKISFNSQNISNESRSSRYLGKENNTFQTGPPISGIPTQNSLTSQTVSNDSWGSSYSSGKERKSHQSWEPSRENPTQNSFGSQTTMSNENVKSSSGWMGKSLEGSAVKEPDPLDMSEEAKAERWFRRVAQIKDISELSQIPDEDFPSIMPMRKGVNRFVVSKRKTPLERRLTSPQYRRNLPVVTSDPLATKKENDNNS